MIWKKKNQQLRERERERESCATLATPSRDGFSAIGFFLDSFSSCFHKSKLDYKQLLCIVILCLFFFGPATDILTYVVLGNSAITPGIIIRCLFLLLAVIYLTVFDSSRRKLNILMLTTLSIIMVFVIINNFEYVRALDFQYFNYIFKYIYLCVGLIYFSSYFQSSRKAFSSYVFRIPLIIIIFGFFIPAIAGGVNPTYDTWGYGHSGWFNSPNELGALLCCLFPLALYNAFRKDQYKKIFGKILDILIVIFISVIMLSLGTKAPLIGFLSISGIYFIYRIITIKTNSFNIALIIMPILIIVSLLAWDNLPAIKNTNLRLAKIQNTSQNVQKQRNADISDSVIADSGDLHQQSNEKISDSKNDPTQVKSNTSAFVLNGRDDFERAIIEYRTTDKATNKVSLILFGKFYSYEDKILITERDFHDIFYLFGLLGLLFIIILLLPIVLAAIINFLSTIKKESGHLTFILLVSVGITILASYISGHALLSPSVSSFFMVSFSLLLAPRQDKKTVAFVASAGGHLTQIMRLKPLFNEYYSFIVTEKTPIKLAAPIPISYVLYCSRKQRLSYLFKATYNVFCSFWIFAKINPDVVVTTGSHTAVPFCIYSFLFRKKFIYIESFAKSSSQTMTGRIVYPLADTFIVQWESMKKFYPKAKYFGGIY